MSYPETLDGDDTASDRLLELPTPPASPHRYTGLELQTEDLDENRPALDAKITRLLYTSHFLSTWNSRAFEFGAFLFLATIYPQTLLPASVYALARAGSAAILSPWVGSYVDHGERLFVVRWSIIGQRAAVSVSCLLLFAMLQLDIKSQWLVSYSTLAVLSVLACVEKLSAIMNTICVERDWVVIIARDNEDVLRTMNSQMRRIDLFCKLVAPLAVSLIDTASSKVAIVVTGAMTALSVFIEYFAIARVHATVPGLREPKPTDNNVPSSAKGPLQRLEASLESTLSYIRHKAFLPSFSLALLYLTVLSFNGQMITYLLAIGMSSSVIGILRGVSALFELSATWIAPKIMQRIGSIRSGIWFINFQMVCVSIACIFFWLPTSLDSVKLCAAGAVAAVVASRVGLWGFDLSAQIIVQEEVEPELRGIFSSQEFAFQNIFEMLSFASTIVFARPQQFEIPATISAFAVSVAGILYAAFVRARRGHLVHLSKCMQRHEKTNAGGERGEWRRIPQEDATGPEDF